MSFIQEKTFHGLGEYSSLEAVELGSKGNFAQEVFCFPHATIWELVLQSVRRGNIETGHDWLGGQGFPS